MEDPELIRRDWKERLAELSPALRLHAKACPICRVLPYGHVTQSCIEQVAKGKTTMAILSNAPNVGGKKSGRKAWPSNERREETGEPEESKLISRLKRTALRRCMGSGRRYLDELYGVVIVLLVLEDILTISYTDKKWLDQVEKDWQDYRKRIE